MIKDDQALIERSVGIAAARLVYAYELAWERDDVKHAAGLGGPNSADRRHQLALEVAKVASA